MIIIVNILTVITLIIIKMELSTKIIFTMQIVTNIKHLLSSVYTDVIKYVYINGAKSFFKFQAKAKIFK